MEISENSENSECSENSDESYLSDPSDGLDFCRNRGCVVKNFYRV